MADRDPEPVRVDPRLIRHFALFRESIPGLDGALDEAEMQDVAVLSRAHPHYAFDRIAKVIVEERLTFLVIPGENSILMVPPRGGGSLSVLGSPTEVLLKGRPVGSSGSLFFGLAIDGVEEQPVQLRDGSTVDVPVRRNVYAIDDPTWRSPVFVR